MWSAPPLLVFTVLRRYLQAMNIVRPILFAVVTANVVNVVANWALVFGHLGLPAMGVVGSAYATLAARVYMMAVLAVVVVGRERRRPSGLHDVPFAIDVARMWSLVRLGSPAALQLMLEVGVFAAASGLAAVISPAAVAAHQIVLNIASFFFMIPYGLSSAGAVRVGHAVGRGDPRGARRAGWAAIGLSLVPAVVMSGAFVIAPTIFLRIFTEDPAVLATGVTLLLFCAIFQPFDSVQSVATGALRGLGETRVPMIANLAGHWIIGLPLAYWLCFTRQWGVVGIWSGLTMGLVLIGTSLAVVWNRKSRPT
jgi:multidrug resistance protein, MATE family